MNLIPIEPSDALNSLIESMGGFPLSFERINHPGDYENENIVLIANEDIESLYDFIFVYSVEDTETGLPIYNKCRLLTFDCIELQKGDRIQIYTRGGEDKTTIDADATAFYNIVYWGLTEPIWHIPHSSFEIIKRGDSYSSGFSNDSSI